MKTGSDYRVEYRIVRPDNALPGWRWNTLVDPSQLENALLNLCINARDAMPDGGMHVLTKPFAMDTLAHRIRDLMVAD